MGKRTASAETLKPDPRHNSKLASKFINCLMWQGKKPTAQRVFYGALDQIKKRMPDADPIEVFTQAVEHVKPTVEVRSKRVGGATYQVPMQVNRTRQQSLAIRWIISRVGLSVPNSSTSVSGGRGATAKNSGSSVMWVMSRMDAVPSSSAFSKASSIVAGCASAPR